MVKCVSVELFRANKQKKNDQTNMKEYISWSLTGYLYVCISKYIHLCFLFICLFVYLIHTSVNCLWEIITTNYNNTNNLSFFYPYTCNKTQYLNDNIKKRIEHETNKIKKISLCVYVYIYVDDSRHYIYTV